MIFHVFVGLLFILNLTTSIDVPSLIQEAFSEPANVGLLHTEVFERLSAKYEHENPSSREQVLDDLRDVLYGFCDEIAAATGWSFVRRNCERSADEAMRSADERIRRRLREHGRGHERGLEVVYPEGTDGAVADLLDRIFSALRDYANETKSLDDVLEEIDAVRTSLSSSSSSSSDEDVAPRDPYHRFVSLGAANVAAESLLLWHAVDNDPNHVLHRVAFSEGVDVDGHRRRLQENGLGPAYTSAISIADTVGHLALCPPVWALSTGISLPLYLIPVPFVGTLLSPLLYLFLVPLVMGHTLFSSAFSGTAWLFLEFLSPALPNLDDDEEDASSRGTIPT